MAVSRRRFLQHSAWAAAACATTPLSGWARGVNKPAGDVDGAPGHNQAKPGKAPALTPATYGAIGHLSQQDFVQVIGSSFQVTLNSKTSAPVFLRLLAVDDPPAPAPVNPASFAVSPKQTSAPVVTSGFTLSFGGTGTKQLPQGTYVFQHDVLGQFALFVVPGTGAQQTCTAVVNQLGASNARLFQKR